MELFKIMGFFSIPILLLGILTSYIIATMFDNYDIMVNYISDLGVSDYTPIPALFNIVLMLAGICFIFFYSSLYEHLPREFEKHKPWARIASILLLISASNLYFAGFYNLEVCPDIHNMFAVIMFLTIFLGGVIIGVLYVLKYKNYLYAVISTPIIIKIFILMTIFSFPILEWMFFIMIFIWSSPYLIKIYVKLYNH